MFRCVAEEFDAADNCYLYGKGRAGRVAEKFSLKTIWSTFRELLNPLLTVRLYVDDYAAANILFFATTKNQVAALLPVAQELKERGQSICWLRLDSRFEQNPMSLGLRELLQFYLFLVGLALLKPRKTRSAIEKIGGRRFVSAFFYFYWGAVRLRNFEGILFLSNDHSLAPRSILKAAKMIGVRTAYVQHASVTEIFPPLEFDVSFLDGDHAVKIYRNIAKINGAALPDICVFGSPRMDAIFRLRDARSFARCDTVGVAVNTLDNPVIVRNYLRLLVAHGHIVVLRLHPRQDNVEQYEDIVSEFSGAVRISGCQSLAAYLESIELNFAGDSSIHLEAVASGVATFYCDFCTSLNDYYGFVACGVAYPFGSIFFDVRGSAGRIREIYLSQSQALSFYFSNRDGVSSASLVANKVISLLENAKK